MKNNDSKIGTAGKIAGLFIKSKLTLLIVITSIILGVYGLIETPREEEPQIIVPMIDVFVQYPGASSSEVENLVTKPMAKLLYEIKGVEYVYTMSKPGMSIAITRFYVGEDTEDSIVKLYNKLMSNYDMIPPGVSEPLVKPRSINDVPILTFTLWSDKYGGYELRRIAYEVADELKKDKDVADYFVTGGQKRQLKISVQPSELQAHGVSPARISNALKASNLVRHSGDFPYENEEYRVETGGFLKDPHDIGNIVVTVSKGKPVYLNDVSEITDEPEEPTDYVFMGFGPASETKAPGLQEAVTISIAKKKGTNATDIAERLNSKVEVLEKTLIPAGVDINLTRNYGETAKEKSDELLEHMLIAAISVTLLIAFVLGWRESIVVLVAIPVTISLTIFTSYMLGYTLNRVTLFALIFSIGILVDDAIVVVENIYRHFQMGNINPQSAVRAVDEVGNPTILATFTVISALIPMAMVSGLMGPYMEPIPVGASAAMLISLLIAFIISPWLSFIVLKGIKKESNSEGGEGRLLGYLNHVYEKNLRTLLESSKMRILAYGFVGILLGASFMFLVFKVVTVKMLPFDNKSELQVIIDMPEGTTLEETAALSREVGKYIETIPEVTDYQIYNGTAAPFNFNGLVRHYFLRDGSNVADIQVNFTSKDKRDAQSHDIAKRIRPQIIKIGKQYGANIKIVEVPPGPPVRSTLVAEIYGPDHRKQLEVASEVKQVFKHTKGVVDVDWSVESEQKRITFDINKKKAALNGVSTEHITKVLNTYLGGEVAGLAHMKNEKEPVEILIRAPLHERAGVNNLSEIRVINDQGKSIPISELVDVRMSTIDKTIHTKNLKKVVYVTGDVAGEAESPVYAILNMDDRIEQLGKDKGYEINQLFTSQPENENEYSLKWDGEWHITYEVFRDLGLAFAGALILIYIMVVGWFRSFMVPLVIMAPIPLSLIGIIPGHAIMGAFFTATSMIGFIAGAGIVVRNSIILVDFIELKLSEGVPLKEAVVDAGVIRFRPMLLTAASVVVGSSVILFDPIFQGMAISLMAGEVAATILSRTMVPVLYYEYRKAIS